MNRVIDARTCRCAAIKILTVAVTAQLTANAFGFVICKMSDVSHIFLQYILQILRNHSSILCVKYRCHGISNPFVVAVVVVG